MPTPFLFGKMPAHGDFVSRGLRRPYREAWDLWCSSGLVRARGVLGNAFAEKHMAAEACCFWFGPGPFGRGWRMGAMAPTRDRLGRPFMLILGVESEEPFCAHVARAYPGMIKPLIRHAMAEGWNADETVKRLPVVPEGGADLARQNPGSGGCFWRDSDIATGFSISTCTPPNALILIMMNAKEVIDDSGLAI